MLRPSKNTRRSKRPRSKFRSCISPRSSQSTRLRSSSKQFRRSTRRFQINWTRRRRAELKLKLNSRRSLMPRSRLNLSWISKRRRRLRLSRSLRRSIWKMRFRSLHSRKSYQLPRRRDRKTRQMISWDKRKCIKRNWNCKDNWKLKNKKQRLSFKRKWKRIEKLSRLRSVSKLSNLRNSNHCSKLKPNRKLSQHKSKFNFQIQPQWSILKPWLTEVPPTGTSLLSQRKSPNQQMFQFT